MSSQYQNDGFLRIVLIVLAVVVLVPLLLMMLAIPMMGMMGWWWGGGGPRTVVSPIWGIGMMLVFLVGFLGVSYVLYRGLVAGQGLERDRALEELRTAYARGDLTDEEFERRRERLQSDRE